MTSTEAATPDRRTQIAVAIVVGCLSVTLWWATMASAPRFSHGPHEDMGDTVIFPLLLLASLVGGALIPKHANLIGVMLVAPALLLSPWTAPRGDNDGLWLYIVPALAVLMGLCVLLARAGAWVRSRIEVWRTGVISPSNADAGPLMTLPHAWVCWWNGVGRGILRKWMSQRAQCNLDASGEASVASVGP